MFDLDLARRAVACKGWRWMPGMLDSVTECRVEDAHSDGAVVPLECSDIGYGVWDAQYSPRPLSTRGALPDLSDPATLGCLLALVREAWGDPLITVAPDAGEDPPVWLVFSGTLSGVPIAGGPSEAVALVAALEAAMEAAP